MSAGSPGGRLEQLLECVQRLGARILDSDVGALSGLSDEEYARYFAKPVITPSIDDAVEVAVLNDDTETIVIAFKGIGHIICYEVTGQITFEVGVLGGDGEKARRAWLNDAVRTMFGPTRVTKRVLS